MIYRLRIILDVKEDVLRDIEIEDSATFEDLHHAITQAFGYLGNEMASFYLSNENWEQGEELPLEAMDISQESFQDKELNTIISATQHQLIYVYDFLNLWTFFVELMEVGELLVGTIYPNLIHAQGDVPEEAPEKIFESQNSEGEDHEGDFEEDDTDDYDENEFY